GVQDGGGLLVALAALGHEARQHVMDLGHAIGALRTLLVARHLLGDAAGSGLGSGNSDGVKVDPGVRLRRLRASLDALLYRFEAALECVEAGEIGV
ncbi:hypothetical protein AB0064_27240, partial [Klebsiella pneumoniae]